jgi:hypothetical protein
VAGGGWRVARGAWRVKGKLVERGGWRVQISASLPGDVLGWDQVITGAGSLPIRSQSDASAWAVDSFRSRVELVQQNRARRFGLKNYQRHDYQKKEREEQLVVGGAWRVKRVSFAFAPAELLQAGWRVAGTGQRPEVRGLRGRVAGTNQRLAPRDVLGWDQMITGTR